MKRSSDETTQKKRIRLDNARRARLDVTMAKLDAVVAKTNTGTIHQKQEKQDRINQTVRRMLVKSRAECGDRKQIREDDRFYVELVTVHDVVNVTDATANEKTTMTRIPSNKTTAFFPK